MQGFSVKQDDYVLGFTDEEIIKYGLIRGENIFFCKKVWSFKPISVQQSYFILFNNLIIF